MNWHDIVYDPGSTTKAFKIIASDYKLEVLFSGLANDKFKRVILISLDQIPVMIATSTTQVDNPLFLDILQNAGTVPIGVRLFAPNSGINRGDMQVDQINTSEINDKLILENLKNRHEDEKLYFRQSMFTYGNQAMQLDEYVLSGLKVIIDKYNRV